MRDAVTRVVLIHGIGYTDTSSIATIFRPGGEAQAGPRTHGRGCDPLGVDPGAPSEDDDALALRLADASQAAEITVAPLR